ncbi:MAG: hypothetical protein AAB893_02645, partial [Patescibacteria group bacterium]
AEGVTFEKHIASAAAILAAPDAQAEFGINAPTVKTNGESSGEAVLPDGYTELVFISKKIKADSLIYLSPLSATNNQTLYIDGKAAATQAGNGWFKVKIDQAQVGNIKFGWWIL